MHEVLQLEFLTKAKECMSPSILRTWLYPLRNTPLHPQWLIFREQQIDRRWIADHARGRVLDIGCADGWASKVLSECEYVGLDYPNTASALYGTSPQVFADGAFLPFLSSSFETVLLLEVLEHVRNPEKVLKEISRVLKPSGKLLISVPFLYPLHDSPHDYRRYTAPGLVQILTEAGLRPGVVLRRNAGLKTAALLGAIACAEFVIEASRSRRWKLIFTPFFIIAIPIINILGCVFGFAGEGQILASGHATQADKPL
jgi:SAM-dependent methyltransferase